MIDKRTLEAIENATRATRLLEEAGGRSRLAKQMDAAALGVHRFQEMEGLTKAAEIAAQLPSSFAGRSALHKEFERMELARRAMQPISSVVDRMEADRLSVTAQALALRLPHISLTEIAAFKAIGDAHKAMAASFRPTDLVAREMAERVALLTAHHQRFADLSAWAGSLELRMEQIDVAWAMRDRLAISGLAFGGLAQFSDTVRFEAPFAEATNEAVVEELGAVINDDPEDTLKDREARYDAAGRNPSLVAFPEPAYDIVVVASGFVLEFPPAPAPQAIENVVGVQPIADVHHAAVRDIENHLRAFIVRHLSTVEPKWEKQRVPGDMHRKWRERQDVDRALKRAVYPAIYYADLAELGQVIAQNNNWPVFQPFFETRDGLLVSLSRLTPIRNAIAHGRPLSQTDVLNIVAEGARIMRAVGVLILQ